MQQNPTMATYYDHWMTAGILFNVLLNTYTKSQSQPTYIQNTIVIIYKVRTVECSTYVQGIRESACSSNTQQQF